MKNTRVIKSWFHFHHSKFWSGWNISAIEYEHFYDELKLHFTLNKMIRWLQNVLMTIS